MMGGLRIITVAAVVSAAATTAALAQEEAVPEADERIVVTATRRGEDLSTTVGTVTMATGEEIAFVRADHVSEMLNRLPGVFSHRNNGQDHLTAIRSPILTGGAGAGSFLYLEDGVPLRAAGFANVNGLFEAMTEFAGGMEVVRGPGSVLYGSNAVHGLINVLTPEPFDIFGSVLSVSAGSFGRYGGQAVVSGTEGAHGLLAAVSLSHEDGWRDDAGTDQQKALMRWDYEAGGLAVRTTLAYQNLNQESAGFIEGDDAYKNSVLSRTNSTPEGFRDARSLRFASRIEWQESENLVLSVTPFARSTDMEFLMTFLPSLALEENGHDSAGALATAYWTFDERHTLIVGADAEFTDGFLKETQELASFGSFPQGVHYDFDVFSRVLAGYVQGETWISPRLKFTAGVRIDHTLYDYINNTDADTVGRFKRPADREDTYTTVTPKVGALYQLGDRAALYMRYARGARAPQTTDLYRLQINQDVGEIETEILDSIEAGLRGEWHGIAYDLTGYFAQKENFFFRDTDGFNVPDGKTRHAGFEFDILAPLGYGLTVAASGTYAQHTYCFDNTVAVNSTESIRKGGDVDTAPRTLLNARLIWEPLEDIKTELEWVHVGEYAMDASNTVFYAGHDLFNLRGSWDLSDRFGIFAAVRNLTNTDYANRADFSFGSERYFPGEDRSFSGGFQVKM